MTIPDFLRFTPAPVRARRDGWTPAIQQRFILLLARGASAVEAARGVGRSRSTAYALRERPDATGFAAAWDAALGVAATTRQAARPGLLGLNITGTGGLEEILVPRFYRGRLIGFVRREDHGAAFRTLRRLDRMADRREAAEADEADGMRL